MSDIMNVIDYGQHMTTPTLQDRLDAQDRRIAELEAHIRAIAEHHQEIANDTYDCSDEYHYDRRDFALSIFKSLDELAGG